MKDIFLCHTGADKQWVAELGARLEEERITGRRIEVFFDEWDIDYGENIITRIDQGLKQSRYVGLVLSPRMVQADWPTAEWQSQIMADPAGKRGKILPLLRHKFDPESGEPIDMPFILSPLKRFDFTRDQDFEREVQRLVRKLADLPPSRGPKRGGLGLKTITMPPGQDAADVVEEVLPSNLFAVTDVPAILYSDATSAKDKREVWAKIRAKNVPPFVLFQNRLVSCVPPEDPQNPFTECLNGTDQQRETTAEWMRDVDKKRQVIGLLNAALKEHCYHLGVHTSKRDRTQYYCPIFRDGIPREFRWGTSGGAAGRSRVLAKMRVRPDGSAFGVHMSARMRFLSLGDRVFLLVEPGWVFSTDGISPLEGPEVGRFSTLWGGRERNAAVLRNVLMWGLLVANGAREIRLNVGTTTTPIHVVIHSVPVHSKVNRGIHGDAIRLDRILGGEGAGEVKRLTSLDADSGELDAVADLALVTAFMGEVANQKEALNEDAEDAQADGGDDGQEEELELPF